MKKNNSSFQIQVLEALGILQRDLTELKHDVASIKLDVISLNQDITSLKQDVASLKQDTIYLKKDNKRIHQKLDALRQSDNRIIDFFDKQNLYSKQRFDRIENKLNLPELPYAFN